MAEDDLSIVVGGPEGIGFKWTFECFTAEQETVS